MTLKAALLVFFLSPVLKTARADALLSCASLKPIAQTFVYHHYDAGKLDETRENHAIEKFIKYLDPSKIYLLQSDVEQIRAELKGVFQKLDAADCSPIEKAHALLVKRFDEAYEFARKSLGPDFKFVEKTELMLNADHRQFPKTKAEQQAQMMKFIQFQISNYLASDTKLPQAKTQLIHRYELNAKRQHALKQDELYSNFLDAFAMGLDAHSSYMSHEVLEDFEISMRLSLEGIGAQLSWDDGYTVVEALIPGGSADRSKELKPKDKIIGVAQGSSAFEQVIDMPLRDVVKLIRGKKGTTVRLNVLRQDKTNTAHKIVALKRDKINLADEEAKLYYTNRKVGDRNLKIGIIDLPSFYGDLASGSRSCYEDMKKRVEQASREGADALVLDLSKNGGGLLTEAVRIGGLFIRKGNIVATQNSKHKLEMLADSDDTVNYKGPLVVLTSRLSASASEIVAGALQDYHRAVIVGADHTFGKGTVQAMVPMHSQVGGGAMKVTTGMFFIPGGESTQYRGVPADVTVPSIFSTKDFGEENLDYSLQHRAIPAFTSKEANKDQAPDHWDPITNGLIQKLKVASKARVDKEPEFKKIREELADMEKKKGVISLEDSLKKAKEEKAKPQSKQAKRGKRQSDEEYLKTPQVAEAASVAADLALMEEHPATQAAQK